MELLMEQKGQQGIRGKGQKTYAYWEELPHLKIENAEPVSIFKRLDTELKKSIENRNYQLFIPVPNTRGIKKSLKETHRTKAISKAEQEVISVK